MAQRPVFIPSCQGSAAAQSCLIEFEWQPGMSASQKQRSIDSLHSAAREAGIGPILEISSESRERLGRDLSAFSLQLELPELRGVTTVESTFQGSKTFVGGGPYQDLYQVASVMAKRDDRLRSSGALTGFRLGQCDWPTEPKTAFYDWLYLNALRQHPTLSRELTRFEGFTDIEFNPAKSFSCQARSAALFVALDAEGILADVTRDRAAFLAWSDGTHAEQTSPGVGEQFRLL